jgi:hypothetical protein
MGEIDKLGVDAERAAGGRFWHDPTTPSVFDYSGRQSPGCTSFPRHRQGPRADLCHGKGRKDSPRAAGGAQRRLSSWRDEVGQPPSRARQIARRRGSGSAPQCKFSSLMSFS